MGDDLYRREVLRKAGAAGSAALGIGLAGCSDAESQIRDNPNQYDYQFVEGDDLARNLAKYDASNDEEKYITTQTTVQFDRFLPVEPDKNMRVYTATPDDTIQEFKVAEETNGPIQKLFGEQLDTEEHHDVPLQLYGFVDVLRDEGENGDNSDYVKHTFMVEGAERVDQ